MQSKTFRLFISSTFSDFNEERRLLQTYVFPKVKDYCSGKGYTFQPIDLRWGVSNEAQLDQKTLELCINEVHASKLQPHPNFLIMAGDRYGWVPCPYAIEEEEFKAIKKQVKATDEPLTIEYKEYKVKDSNACETGDKGSFDEQDNNKIFKPNDSQITKIELLEKWYKLDENQIPPSYILQERVNNEHSCYESYQYWEAEENALREILQTAVELTNLDITSKEKYFDSATEQEVFNGIIKYKDKTKFQQDELINKNKDYESQDESHVYGYIRNIKTVNGKKPKTDTEFFDKEDLQPRIHDFKQQLRDSIKAGNFLEFVDDADLTNFNKDEKNKSLNYEYDSIGTKSDKDSEKESEFVEGMLAYLEQSINDFDKDIKSIGLDSPEAIEIESQRVFKDDKAKGFVGREDDLEAIQSYIEGDNNQALVIYGPSGMGKSALMAKAIEQTEDKYKDKQKVIYRFVASTASLSTSIEVLISMLKELGIEEFIQTTKDDSGQDKPEDLDQFFARVSGHLSSLTEPTTIFIDAVDQFTNKDALEDKHEFIWLPSQLPDNLKIVISALEDDKYPEDSKYLELLKSKISNQDNLHKLEPFNDKHAEEMIHGILAGYGRSITLEQQSYLFEQQDSKQPLYLSIAAQELKHWKSTDVTKAYQAKGEGQDLAPTQREIIDEYIQNLTELYHHDQDLVHRVVSYLHLTDGLSESELLEILSTDEDFIDHIAPDTYHNKTEKQLPVVIWARLHSQLKPFLKLENKDGQETMGFFHREFDSAVAEQENIQQTHERLIEFVLELMQKYQDQPFDSNRYGKLYIELVAEHYRRYNEQEALEQNGRNIAIIKNESYLDSIIKRLLQIGGDLQSNMQIPESIIYLTPNLFYVEELYQENPSVWTEGYTASLGNLAVSYANNNQIDEAITLQEKSLEITKPLYQENPSVWAEGYTRSLNNLASSYTNNNQTDQAISLEEKALEITKPLYQENPSVWAEGYIRSLINRASSYRNNSQTDQAISLEEKALEITKPLYQENPSVWAKDYTTSLINLAGSYTNNNQTDQAISLQEKALEITKPLYQENPSVWAERYTKSLNNLASSYAMTQDGMQQFWYENSQKQAEINYKDGQKDGLETQWHENGQKQAEINYKDGKQEGLKTWWYENGQKKSEINYANGKKGGLSTQWYENSQKQAEINYKDGKQEGLKTWWHENGQKESEINYADGKKEGLSTQWYENSQKQAEINYKDGKQEGLTTWWRENGQKKSEINYADGKKEGLSTQWYENGQKQSEINYKDGQKEGLTTWWYKNGQKQAEINYKDGQKEGLITEWRENSQKQSEINYKDGQKDGLETQWLENGQKKSEINYANGKKEGLSTQWYENGQKQSEINYKDGKQEGLTTWWYKNGQKQAESNYADDKVEGLTKWWHDDGSKDIEVNFKDDERHGARTIWDKEGNVIFSATYNNGESNDQNGLEPQYDEDGLTHHIEYKHGVVVNERVEIKE
jgi:antitoxin component YwqK of YwqJK toxin-antitoxin module/archaellum biogenesis ATPase FlaH